MSEKSELTEEELATLVKFFTVLIAIDQDLKDRGVEL